MISLSGLGMRFGAQVLFEQVSWQLQPGGHYGLVGANGAGKSTLLRLLSGELSPDSGVVSRPNALALGALGQDHFEFDDEMPLDVVISGNPLLSAALKEKSMLLGQLEPDGGSGEREGHRLAELEAVIADADGYQAESKAGALLEGLGIASEKHRKPMRELSGGFRLRVLLARTLFSSPELLLLDEPTNHLDIDSIRWLEGHLNAFAGTFVVVSHDRHFLNAICSQIADLDYGELRLYPGNYDAFLKAKELAVQQKETEITRAEEKIAEAKKFIDRFRAKATKARQAQSRKKQVERIVMPDIKRSTRRHPAFGFAQHRPSGRDVLTVQGVSKRYGEHSVLSDVSFSLHRGEKLAVVGPNGIGKSTLLKIIAGEIAQDAGRVVPGYEVHAGYFAQDHRESLRGRTSVYEWLYALSSGETVGAIRGILGKVLFSGDDVDKSVADLSGGEAARLLLAGLMLRRDNFLVLDEPTNHLDLEGREALMLALREYEGTLIFVSHDRHFVSSVGRRLLVISRHGVEDVQGNYEEYLARQGEDFLAAGSRDASDAASPRASQTAPSPRPGPVEDHRARKDRKRALSHLRKRVERFEMDIARLEKDISEVEERFAREGYYDKTPWHRVQQEQRGHKELKQQLRSTMKDWERAASELDELQPAS